MGTHEGFSIREYVSRMRSVNVVKCWPFDEAISEESVKSLLPPITVKKFIWWLDGLDYLHSESSQNVDSSKKKQKRKKKMVQEKRESSLRSEDDVEEFDVDVGEGMEVVKLKSSRAKAKAPKKRSILEIFAEAPPVERVSSEEGEEEENSVQEEDGFCTGSNLSSHEEINWGLKGKRNEKKEKTKKNKEIILSKLKKANKMIRKIKKQKQTQKKGDDKMDSNKENCFAFKICDQDKAIGNSNSSHTRENENDICDRASIRKKKPRLQHLNGNKKTMTCKASKLTAENQHPGKPTRGILKNHGKASSLQQSTKCILQEAVQVNQWGNQKADKHVTFLQKDNMLRLRRKPSNPVELFNMLNCSSSDMHNVHHAGGVRKDSAIVETSGSEDVSNRTENEVDGSPASKEQLTIPSCIVDTSSFMKQHKKEEHISRSVTSDITLDGKNEHSFDTGLSEAPYDPKYACLPGFSCMAREANYNSQNVEFVMNSSSSTGGRLIKDLGTPGPRVPSMCFEDFLKTYEPSASNLSTLGKRENKMRQASSQSTSLDDAHPMQYETPLHLFPRELLQTVCSPPEGYPTGNVHGKRTIHGINEDFVGLPLNSQGELITLSSRAKGNLHQTIKSSTSAAPSIGLSLPSNALSKCFVKHSDSRIWDCRTSSRDQLNLLPVEGYLKENPVVFVPSRLGITECQGNGQTNLDFELIKVNDHSFHSENTLCKEDGQAQKSHGNDKILSTMRLMGKDFVIGRRGFQGFEDGHIWKDKQIIDQLHFNDTSISNIMMHDQNEPSLGELRETLFCPSEMTINHESGSTYAFPHFDCQTSSVHQRNGFVARKFNPVENLYPALSPGTLAAVHNSESLFLEPFPTGYKSQVFNLELPTPQTAHQDSSPKVSSSDIQLKNKQNLRHAPRSAIRFPFMHPDLGGHAQSSWSGSSHVNQSPLLFDVSKKGTPISNSHAYHNLGGSHHLVIPGTNQWTDSSVSLKPEALCLYNPFSSRSTLQSSIALAASPPTMLNQQAPMLCYPGIVPISTVEKRYGNQKKVREQIKSRIGIRGLGHGRKAKRQPSAVSSGSIKPVKMPSLGVEEGSQCAITKLADCVNFEDVQNIEAGLDSCSSTKKSNILLYDEYGDDQNEKRIYPWIDSYSSTARTGAIKLTAGAKHILKACQQVDQTSSKSTDPNIPPAAASAGFRFSESENSTKIYKF